MKTIVVTGTDTGVGKTWVSCLLVRSMLAAGIRAGVYKPVCSGAETGDDGLMCWSDVERLCEALLTGGSSDHGIDSLRERICPQRFIAPVAPSVAARMQGQSVDDALLAEGALAWQSFADILIVEGAGGIFCPLSDTTTVMELSMRLHADVIVVAGNRLGVINHTRLTVDALQIRGLNVRGVVLNDLDADHVRSDVSRDSNASQLRHWIPSVPLFTCRWNSDIIRPHHSGTHPASLWT